MNTNINILVTNDDGVQAPGLLALVQTRCQCGNVTVVAPDRDWSGGGHVKTLSRPLRMRQVALADGTEAFAADGASSDCVALAVMGLLPHKVDLIVAGINPAANLGHDVTYSGTVTADQLQGIRVTRQGLRVYRDRLDKRQDPRGRDCYWIGGDSPTGIPEDGTDVGALATGYVSVTPLQLDLTAYPALSTLSNWQWGHIEPTTPPAVTPVLEAVL